MNLLESNDLLRNHPIVMLARDVCTRKGVQACWWAAAYLGTSFHASEGTYKRAVDVILLASRQSRIGGLTSIVYQCAFFFVPMASASHVRSGRGIICVSEERFRSLSTSMIVRWSWHASSVPTGKCGLCPTGRGFVASRLGD